MAWYGVNFVLGAGLHSCGFGGGGVPHVFAELGLQGLFAAAAAVRYVASGAAAEAERAARQSLPRADQRSPESFPSPSQPESPARTGRRIALNYVSGYDGRRCRRKSSQVNKRSFHGRN